MILKIYDNYTKDEFSKLATKFMECELENEFGEITEPFYFTGINVYASKQTLNQFDIWLSVNSLN